MSRWKNSGPTRFLLHHQFIHPFNHHLFIPPSIHPNLVHHSPYIHPSFHPSINSSNTIHPSLVNPTINSSNAIHSYFMYVLRFFSFISSLHSSCNLIKNIKIHLFIHPFIHAILFTFFLHPTELMNYSFDF